MRFSGFKWISMQGLILTGLNAKGNGKNRQ
jgi:hypothetical protein